MPKWNRVAIVGVGLIGGSIGLALRRRKLAKEVVGIGRRPQSLRQALQVGAVTKTTRDLARGVKQADLVLVCTPVGVIAEQVEDSAAACPEGTLITDAGSTKAEICNRLDGRLSRGVRFVGSHPLAGSEKNGPTAATHDLYVDRTVIVTPTVKTPEGACQAIAEFWTSLGAKVVIKSPEEHDRILAATSHLPHLVASALAASTPADLLEWTATGWADATRIAAGDPDLWTQIFLANRDNMLEAIEQFEARLAALRSGIEHVDARYLIQILTQGKIIRDAVGS